MVPFHRCLPQGCLQPVFCREQPSWWFSCGVLLSPAGHPQHSLQDCPGLGDSRGCDLVAPAKKQGANFFPSIFFSSCLCGFRHPSAMFFPCPRRGGRSAKLTSGRSCFFQTDLERCGPLVIQGGEKLLLTARRCLYPLNPQLPFIGVSNQLGPSTSSWLL